MHLSRIELRPESIARPDLLAELGHSYSIHQLVWSLMSRSPQQTRDFLFRQEGAGREVRLYVLSEHEPHDQKGIWSIKSKPYAPRVEAGMSFRFLLRANATVSRGGQRAKGEASQRHDVVMDLKTRLRKEGKPLPSTAELVQRAGEEWFAAQCTRIGADIRPGTLFVDGYQKHRVVPRGEGERRPIEFSTLDLEGTVSVVEPRSFAKALRQGVGHARAFGCGLLMIQPA
jgi:CRISPR system Cascade subunit CasE